MCNMYDENLLKTKLVYHKNQSTVPFINYKIKGLSNRIPTGALYMKSNTCRFLAFLSMLRLRSVVCNLSFTWISALGILRPYLYFWRLYRTASCPSKCNKTTTATNQITDATYTKAKNVNVCNEFIYKFIQSCVNSLSQSCASVA